MSCPQEMEQGHQKQDSKDRDAVADRMRLGRAAIVFVTGAISEYHTARDNPAIIPGVRSAARS